MSQSNQNTLQSELAAKQKTFADLTAQVEAADNLKRVEGITRYLTSLSAAGYGIYSNAYVAELERRVAELDSPAIPEASKPA